MGSLISWSKQIEALRFVKLSTRPLKAKRIFKRGYTVIVELESGALWSPTVNGRYAYSPGSDTGELLQLLVDLGRISKADFKRHREHVQAAKVEKERNNDRQTFIRLFKKHAVRAGQWMRDATE